MYPFPRFPPCRTQVHPAKKTAKATSQTGTKIMVRNIPFQAKQNEIQEIFQWVCTHGPRPMRSHS